MDLIATFAVSTFTFHLSQTASFTVRVVVDDAGDPLFVAADVCSALGIGNTTDALSRLDPEDRTFVSIEGASNGLAVNAVNESGLYSLILGSRKPEAKPFKRWVTAEVLPSIRKTGQYALKPPVSQPALPQTYIAALEDLLAAKKAEQMAIEQRDEAIRTKALIGSKREATAMATASAAKREASVLRDRLGECTRHATVTAVEKVTGRRYEWAPLRRWCRDNNITPFEVQDPRYGSVKSWPAAAWRDMHDVELSEVFTADVIG